MYDPSELIDILRYSNNAVFLGGAGVSTDSGLPDFRGTGGLYSISDPDGSSVSDVLSLECLKTDPERFYEFYRSYIFSPFAQPNAAHIALARLERAAFVRCVITQNVIGLHQKAGSKEVIELHGSSHRYYCMRCFEVFDESEIEAVSGVLYCACGGVVRPDVVLYGEAVKSEDQTAAEEAVYEADTLLIGGTSLETQSASSLLSCFEGENLIIINTDRTRYDGMASLLINESIGKVLESAAAELS